MRAVIVLCFVVVAFINPSESMKKIFGLTSSKSSKSKTKEVPVNPHLYPKLGACDYYYPGSSGDTMHKVGPGLVEVAIWKHEQYWYIIGYLGTANRVPPERPLRALVHPKPNYTGQRVKVLMEEGGAYQYFGLKANNEAPHGFMNHPWQGDTRFVYIDEYTKIRPWRPSAGGSSHGAGSSSTQPPMGRLLSLAREPTPESRDGSRDDPEIKDVGTWAQYHFYQRRQPETK